MTVRQGGGEEDRKREEDERKGDSGKERREGRG